MIPKVFLDANILYSNTCRSLFIWLHQNGVVEIKWSQAAWDEVFKNYSLKNIPADAAKFQHSMERKAINFFTDAMVSVYRINPVGLTDPDDEHIVSAAVASDVDVIITNDKVLIQDLDTKSINPVGMTPDDFLMDISVHLVPNLVLYSVRSHIASLIRTRPTKPDYVQSLHKSEMPVFADWINQNYI